MATKDSISLYTRLKSFLCSLPSPGYVLVHHLITDLVFSHVCFRWLKKMIFSPVYANTCISFLPQENKSYHNRINDITNN